MRLVFRALLGLLLAGAPAAVLAECSAWSTQDCSSGGGAGTITGVTAGTGLTGGGTEGDVSLEVTAPVTIALGGTNATSFTSGRVNYFNGTSVVGDADLTFDGTNTTATSIYVGSDGAAATPAIARADDLNTGIYFGGSADRVDITAGGANVWTFENGATTVRSNGVPIQVASNGTAVTPAYGQTSNGMGMYFTATGTAFAFGGVNAATLNASTSTFTGVVVSTSGINIGTSAQTIRRHLSSTASLNFDFSGAGITCQDLTVTVTGAADGDTVAIGVPNTAAGSAGVLYTGFVSASDTVTVRGCDVTSAGGDPGAVTVRADVWQH